MAGERIRGVFRALRAIRPGLRAIQFNRPAFLGVDPNLTLSSPDFLHGTPLPLRMSADGEALFPALSWKGVPETARSLVLLVEDPDAPLPWPVVHAIVHGLAPESGGLAEGDLPSRRDAMPEVATGRNSFAGRGWLPPSPPPGHGPHRYCFQLFALDHVPDFPRVPGRHALVRAMRHHTVGKGLLIGTYERA